MNFENYDTIDYGHNWDSLIILHELCVLYPTRIGSREKNIHLRHIYLICKMCAFKKLIAKHLSTKMFRNSHIHVSTRRKAVRFETKIVFKAVESGLKLKVLCRQAYECWKGHWLLDSQFNKLSFNSLIKQSQAMSDLHEIEFGDASFWLSYISGAHIPVPLRQKSSGSKSSCVKSNWENKGHQTTLN